MYLYKGIITNDSNVNLLSNNKVNGFHRDNISLKKETGIKIPATWLTPLKQSTPSILFLSRALIHQY
jgi:hypothetical protein